MSWDRGLLCWIQPTIFASTRPDMRIVKEQGGDFYSGPVGAVQFEDEEDVLRQANDPCMVSRLQYLRGTYAWHSVCAQAAGGHGVDKLRQYSTSERAFRGYKQTSSPESGTSPREYAHNKCAFASFYFGELYGWLIRACVIFLLAAPTSKPSTQPRPTRLSKEEKRATLRGQNVNICQLGSWSRSVPFQLVVVRYSCHMEIERASNPPTD